MGQIQIPEEIESKDQIKQDAYACVGAEKRLDAIHTLGQELVLLRDV